MNSSKLLRTVLIVAIAALATSGALDQVTRDYAEQSLTRALTTFAVARTLNGVISVAQGTEVAIEPGGVGVVMAPGQLLDPVNDLVERFSGVLLVAASSLGLQIVLLEISSWIGITVLLVVALIIWLAATWSERLASNKYIAVTLRLALVLVFLRFAVSIVIICTNIVFGAFLLEKHDSAAAQLQQTSAQVQDLNARNEESTVPDDNRQAGDSGSSDESSMTVWGRQLKQSAQELYAGVSNWFDDVDISGKMARLEENAANATAHIVNLIVIFVLQTIVFPLGFLWVFVEVLKAAASRSISMIGTGKT